MTNCLVFCFFVQRHAWHRSARHAPKAAQLKEMPRGRCESWRESFRSANSTELALAIMKKHFTESALIAPKKNRYIRREKLPGFGQATGEAK